MTLFLWTALVVTCAGLMWALAAFDRLIDFGNAAGVRIGGREVETAVFSGAKGSTLSGLDRNRLFVKWLFRTPAWAVETRNMRSLFRRFRIGSATAFVGVVSFSAGALLHI